LSKSSWSRRSILRSPFLFIGNAAILPPFHRRGTNIGFQIGDLIFSGGFSRYFKKIEHQSDRAAGSRGLSNGWRSPGLSKQHNLMSIGASHNDREQALSFPISDNA
jgi:hypothetical protein